ncbi:MAG: hypothetical protein E7588_04845 [Ruminococcaceae bacterium]|nr:hypothetical protein [Oscillospiraceae bacterium]
MRLLTKILFLIFCLSVVTLPVYAVTDFELTTHTAHDGIYKLTATGTSDSLINTAEVFMSYDTTVVVPVDRSDYSDVEVETALQGSIAPFESFMNIAAVQWLTSEERTSFKITVYSLEKTDASQGSELFSFFFRVLEGEKIDRNTFRIEKDFSDGSFLSLVYSGNDALNGGGVFFGNDVYAATDSRSDTVLFLKPDISGITANDAVLYGDVNQDGNVNISDAILLMQKLASNAVQLTKNQLKAAECVPDGFLNISDAVRLLQHLANKEVKLD